MDCRLLQSSLTTESEVGSARDLGYYHYLWVIGTCILSVHPQVGSPEGPIQGHWRPSCVVKKGLESNKKKEREAATGNRQSGLQHELEGGMESVQTDRHTDRQTAGSTHIVLDVQVAASFEEDTHNLNVAFVGSQVQGASAILWTHKTTAQ